MYQATHGSTAFEFLMAHGMASLGYVEKARRQRFYFVLNTWCSDIWPSLVGNAPFPQEGLPFSAKFDFQLFERNERHVDYIKGLLADGLSVSDV